MAVVAVQQSVVGEGHQVKGVGAGADPIKFRVGGLSGDGPQ